MIKRGRDEYIQYLKDEANYYHKEYSEISGAYFELLDKYLSLKRKF